MQSFGQYLEKRLAAFVHPKLTSFGLDKKHRLEKGCNVPSLDDFDTSKLLAEEEGHKAKAGSSANIPYYYLRYLAVIITNHQCFYVGPRPAQQLSKIRCAAMQNRCKACFQYLGLEKSDESLRNSLSPFMQTRVADLERHNPNATPMLQ